MLFGPGDTVTGLVVVALGPDRSVTVRNATGDVHVVADLVGTFGPDGDRKVRPNHPVRLADTRIDRRPIDGAPEQPAPLGPGDWRLMAGYPGLFGTLTATAASAPTVLTFVEPPGQPTTADLVVGPGGTRSTGVLGCTVYLEVCGATNQTGQVDVILDLTASLVFG